MTILLFSERDVRGCPSASVKRRQITMNIKHESMHTTMSLPSSHPSVGANSKWTLPYLETTWNTSVSSSLHRRTKARALVPGGTHSSEPTTRRTTTTSPARPVHQRVRKPWPRVPRPSTAGASIKTEERTCHVTPSCRPKKLRQNFCHGISTVVPHSLQLHHCPTLTINPSNPHPYSMLCKYIKKYIFIYGG